jgi:hypothetical protein
MRRRCSRRLGSERKSEDHASAWAAKKVFVCSGALQPGAFLDFYNLHYYDWMRLYFGSPFEHSPADYGMDHKPCIIGETPARGSASQSIADDYRNAFAKGWQGIMPWTSNGADRNKDPTTMRPVLEWLVKTHPQLIDPAR